MFGRRLGGRPLGGRPLGGSRGLGEGKASGGGGEPPGEGESTAGQPIGLLLVLTKAS
jgi:hypothetical protein